MKTEQFQWSSGTGESYRPVTELGGAAQMVTVFYSPDLARDSGLFDSVRAAYPRARIFGCATSGAIAGTSVKHSCAVITAVAFEHTTVQVARAAVSAAADGFELGRTLAASLDPAGLSAVFLIADGVKVNATDTVSGMNSALPKGVCVFGGCTSNGHDLRDTSVICDSPPEDNIIAALGFYSSRLRVGMGSSGGWNAFGLDRLITKSNKNVLYEFEGGPALALYKKYIGPAASGLPGSGMLFPISIRSEGSTHRVLRGVIDVNEAEQSITFAGNVPEGAHARLMCGSKERLVDGSAEAAYQTRKAMDPHPPQLLMVVSCAARQLVLQDRTAEELECFAETFPAGPPIAGFYALGEVATLDLGGPADFHNETLTAAALAEL